MAELGAEAGRSGPKWGLPSRSFPTAASAPSSDLLVQNTCTFFPHLNPTHLPHLLYTQVTTSSAHSNMSSSKPREALEFPDSDRVFLEPHLPPPKAALDANNNNNNNSDTPFVTLTFATSLDSSLALVPGQQTALSGPQSKAMTHYLRSRHDGILIGVGTAVADDPSLNCRLAGVGGYGAPGLAGQPQPIVVDPSARWDFTAASRLFTLCREGRGRPPWVVVAATATTTTAAASAVAGQEESLAEEEEKKRKKRKEEETKRALLEEYGGRYLPIDLRTDPSTGEHRLDWHQLFLTLKRNGLDSVMVEGGGHIINSLLAPPHLSEINSAIVTIAPTWLGQGGVVVSPARRRDEAGRAIPAVRLAGAQWHPFGEDVVLCGSIQP